MKRKRSTPFPSRLASDPLRWAIATVLLAPVGALAEGIVPQAGPAGTPQVEQHGATALINIVPPVNGTSHNQYLGYDVGAGGAVLNNATAAGQSALLGELGANPQFNGAAAGMIINEVVGNAGSYINGPQEIFGQAADYVLANPNGIHINGGRLINAPQSAFLVGTPEVVDGRLVGLNTFDAAGHVQVDGAGLASDGAVRLIAPRVDTNGQMDLPGEATVIAGRNRVAPGGEILETRQGGEQAIDAQLLGAMKAGRIESDQHTRGRRCAPGQRRFHRRRRHRRRLRRLAGYWRHTIANAPGRRRRQRRT
ncbi:two-partner secretion domain-containing protein [Pseudomonas sp. KNUC1026]|uniref:two-partner secretion domain-containing protein n=1 Tax=Pseudomonas sp. KNUC1026 TaxID=2893890 RepID=UPI001F26F562|nr:filamentous hemagglutinin N-terminal domain-containing protein [Pseudomonas sp. KNUC1026]UFH48604.1 filamentous hemagglutinin N-terminal domain-containing protein [Pseudomonas sp. KNUC1026]